MNTISDADAVGVDADTGDVVDIVAAVELVAVDDIVVVAVDDDDDQIGAVVDGDVVDVDVEVHISVAALMAVALLLLLLLMRYC